MASKSSWNNCANRIRLSTGSALLLIILAAFVKTWLINATESAGGRAASGAFMFMTNRLARRKELCPRRRIILGIRRQLLIAIAAPIPSDRNINELSLRRQAWPHPFPYNCRGSKRVPCWCRNYPEMPAVPINAAPTSSAEAPFARVSRHSPDVHRSGRIADPATAPIFMRLRCDLRIPVGIFSGAFMFVRGVRFKKPIISSDGVEQPINGTTVSLTIINHLELN
jgi:hypothetical protein